MSRAGGLLLFMTCGSLAAVAACALVAGIEDINVVSEAGGSDGPVGHPPDPVSNAPPPPTPPGTDGSPGDSGFDVNSFDAGDPCPATETFQAPVLLTSLSSVSDDWSARLTLDENTVVFASSRVGHLGGASIYTATRDLTKTFGTPTFLADVNDASKTIVHPSMTANQLTLVAQVTASPNAQVWSSTRASTGVPFPALAVIPNVNLNNNLNPFITADGSELWFGTDRIGAFRIYAAMAGAGGFATPQLVDLGVTTGDQSPVLDASGLNLYFSSSRADPSYDIYRASRATKTAPWGAPVPITELNVLSKYDAPTWISPDGCRLYFMSNRVGGLGAIDIWEATRLAP